MLELNRKALDCIRAPKRLEIIPRATHLFEEPVALEKVTLLALDSFNRYLRENGKK